MKKVKIADKTKDSQPTAIKIVKFLKSKGFAALFAGGCVRDLVMKKSPEDFDIATSAKPDEIEKLFKKTVPVGKQFGVMIVVENDIPFEVATFRSEGNYADGRRPSQVSFTSPEEDAKRRDFTINGLFYDPIKEEIIDHVGGRGDIHQQVIRTIGSPSDRFNEDKLRLLRAIRFAANLNFKIEDQTWREIKRLAPSIEIVSPERIRDELVKLFTRPNADRGLDLLSESGLLKIILPEIEAMKGVEQQSDFHPEGDVFVHTKLLMKKLEKPTTELAFGALLHDVGKPATFSREKGRITFYNHSHIGSQMAEKILRRLRFSNHEISDILSCVENHMKFADVQVMRVGKLKQFVSRSNFDTELELHRIDCESSHGKLDNYHFLQKKIEEYRKEDLKPKPMINGNDLLTAGYKAGPVIKTILEQVYELQLEGKFKTKDSALAWVSKNFKK